MKIHSIKFNEAEALDFSFALDKAQQALVSKLGTMKRQRKITNPVEHANSIKFFEQKLAHLTDLNCRIQSAAQIGGW